MRIDVIGELQRVFDLEIKTLLEVRGNIDHSYDAALELIANCSGKVVVSGIGKSGDIGRKIVSTLVSTGTLSVFLHPSDAIHGDFGVVDKTDVGLLISKSGESDELLRLLPYFSEMGVKVISITASPESTLGQCSQVVLYTPIEVEACPLNLAPTSSTTAALVVGDALAVSLMKIRGFGVEEFAQTHPGGQLGRRLHTKVLDVMRSGVNNPVVDINESVSTMLDEVARLQSGAVSVIDSAFQLLGLVTDYDIRKSIIPDEDVFSLTIRDVMNPDPVFIYSDSSVKKALDLMEKRERPFLVLPVLDPLDNKVIGMVHLHDLVGMGL